MIRKKPTIISIREDKVIMYYNCQSVAKVIVSSRMITLQLVTLAFIHTPFCCGALACLNIERMFRAARCKCFFCACLGQLAVNVSSAHVCLKLNQLLYAGCVTFSNVMRYFSPYKFTPLPATKQYHLRLSDERVSKIYYG